MVVFITNKARIIKMVLAIVVLIIAVKSVYNINKRLSVTSSGEKKYIAVIIDDFGYNSAGTEEMYDLEFPFTAAVMPNSSTSSADAEKFYKRGCDVIIHLPMEPHTGKKSWLGARGITCDLPDEEINSIVSDAISELKYAIGINNHMGSKVMEDERIMNQILKIVKENDLMFVDSKTTNKSVALGIAKDLSIPYIPRDVFLDGTQDIKKIESRIKEAAKIAKKNGYAIAIGHVGAAGGKVTAQALKNLSKELMADGIEFVTISEIKKRFF